MWPEYLAAHAAEAWVDGWVGMEGGGMIEFCWVRDICKYIYFWGAEGGGGGESDSAYACLRPYNRTSIHVEQLEGIGGRIGRVMVVDGGGGKRGITTKSTMTSNQVQRNPQ